MLNACTWLGMYLLIRINDAFDRMLGAKTLDTVDFITDYWPLMMREEDIEKTEFSCA